MSRDDWVQLLFGIAIVTLLSVFVGFAKAHDSNMCRAMRHLAHTHADSVVVGRYCELDP